MMFRNLSQWWTQWGSTAILAGIVCVLAALLVLQLVKSPESVNIPIAAFRDPTIAAGDLSPAAAPLKEPKAAYRVIAERTLFHPSRRPVPPMAPELKPVAAPPAPTISPSALTPYVLIGIVADSRRSLALLRGAAGSASVVRLAEGDSLHGWTVTKIEADHVMLRAGTSDYVMAFPKPATNRPSANSPAIAPVGAMPVPPMRMPAVTPAAVPSTPQRR